MTTDNWQHFKEVFQSALELPVDERAAYLDRACTEPSFRTEVESLLHCYAGAEDTPEDKRGEIGVSDSIEGVNIKESSIAESNTAQAPRSHPLIETFIDHYQIASKIGGRSGALYRAVRIDDPDKKVAIRLVKTGAGREVFRCWFDQERLILMKLRHPNIAGLLDTGIDKDGEPYLVLEYIEGIQIGEYSDSNKLNTRARITLFLEACHAVQHGHQHFIAHGSLDARSVLVTKHGTGKVLNLGIANLLNRELSSPAAGSSGGAKPEVLEYASPEQIRGEPITAADDVYSLGVLFYQLLTGHSPYRIKGGSADELLPAMFEAIKPSKALDQITEDIRPDGRKITIIPDHLSSCRNEKVATVRRRLAGDLDSIVLKAIQRDAAKRYSTVEQFCGDIQRHLEGRPVSVRKNTLAYRASKFIARHKAGTIAAAIGVTALIDALITMVESLLPR